MEKNLEIEISKTNRGKEQIILNRKYKFNLSSKRKDNSKKYKYEISKSSIPFNVNIKRTYDEISQGMGLICPGYNSIKSQVTRSRRKQLPPDITSFDEIPNESKYYKTKRDENFMIFKNNDLIVFQSPFQAELFSKNKHIFADGTFYIAPIFSYQVFITRTYVTELNCFYTTSFSILKNKKQTTYEILFEEIKKKFYKIKSECQEHNYVQFLEFLEYFKKTYLINYETENWNYYDNIEHITNNVSETFNKYLKKLFAKKTNFFSITIRIAKRRIKILH
ncbi:hypothetical protein LY90DRAFT_644895 [Neocallimastix californiae]|uniref:MULE transposase domain-containing protein n=1 Tax=Neocallimastix californiae TaxID=1754190 RepID=A0A1Y2DCW5_9FUNG|nr:hypothetical protein LY90DRAFT_644895 [Neocallimastix californiae]|eukprot:ORY57037.1 hypothetical protein LY90DRAFT_644895 [Neocallimastix californiae]